MEKRKFKSVSRIISPEVHYNDKVVLREVSRSSRRGDCRVLNRYMRFHFEGMPLPDHGTYKVKYILDKKSVLKVDSHGNAVYNTVKDPENLFTAVAVCFIPHYWKGRRVRREVRIVD